MTPFLKYILADLHPAISATVLFLVGAALGRLIWSGILWLTPVTYNESLANETVGDTDSSDGGEATGSAVSDHSPNEQGKSHRFWMWGTMFSTGALFALVSYQMVHARCQEIPVVVPSETWFYGRVCYHLVLVAFLVWATGTDFRDYVIPDAITFPGFLIGVGAACFVGELQIIHWWIDWNQEVPGMTAPYFPPWIADHQHWHGLVWSLTGAAVGAGATWIVRVVARWTLGQEALGFGDVTFMGMVGSYIGWQPVVFALILAPVGGLVVSLFVRLVVGRTFIPYGPYLSFSTILVLLFWKQIWMLQIPPETGAFVSVRHLFGDLKILLAIAGGAVAAMASVLALIRVYRALPLHRD